MKKKIGFSILALALLCVAGFGLWNWAQSSNQRIVRISTSYPHFELDELVLESDLVVKGTVIEKTEPFKIKPANGGDISIFTDYVIQVEKTLRGKEAKTLNLRMQGGEIGDLTVISEDEGLVDVGESYILFLYHPFAGGGYHTKGDYYYLTGGPQALFSTVDGLETYSSEDVGQIPLETVGGPDRFAGEKAASELSIFSNLDAELLEEKNDFSAELLGGSIALSEQDFTKDLAEFNEETPVDPDYSKKQAEKSLKENLKSGFINQREYDEAMRFDAAYAEIVE